MSFDHAVTTRRLANTPMTDAEWQARVDLAACYRLAAREGWDDLIYTHISARVPGPEHHFLINPFGLAFDEITASSLVKIDLDGTIVGDTPHGVTKAGFVIHSAIHEARPDLSCVMHLHTEAGMALSMLKDGLLPLSQHAMRFYGRIGYHGYEGIALNEDEKKRLVTDLGPHKALILRNHGFLTAGASVAEAYVLMFYLEKAARAQLWAMATGAALATPPETVGDLTARQFEGDSMPAGAREWPALLRRLDREEPDYRE
jgi:ribulose-5-phosphate 4-epimerase/fuculose-1-phosphate aldolase